MCDDRAVTSPTDPIAPSTTPRTIHADRAGGTLAVEWADGHATTFDLVALRWLCPCAYCRGEAGLPGWLDSDPTLTPEQTRLVDMQLVGNYFQEAALLHAAHAFQQATDWHRQLPKGF